jgi:hypothetical protein
MEKALGEMNTTELMDGVTDVTVAVQRMVQGAIERLHDRIDDWVPEALRDVDDAGGLSVTFRVLMTDISKEIERNEQATKMRVAAAENDLAEMLADVDTET